MSRTAFPYLEQVRGALFWHLEWKTLDNQFMDGGKNCNDRRQNSSKREQFSYIRTTIALMNIRYRHNNQIPIMYLIWWSLLIEWSDWLNQVETKQISPPDSLFKAMITDGPGPIWRRAEKRIVEKHVLPIKSLNIWCSAGAKWKRWLLWYQLKVIYNSRTALFKMILFEKMHNEGFVHFLAF